MGSRMRWRAWKPRWSESTRITTRFTSKSTTLATLRLSRWTSEERSWLRCSMLFVISSRWIVRMLFNDTVKNDKSTENGYTSLLRWWAHWLIRSVFRVKGYQAYWWRRISTTISSIPLTFPVSSLSLSPDGEQGHQSILVALMLHGSVIVLGYLASKLNQSRLYEWMNETFLLSELYWPDLSVLQRTQSWPWVQWNRPRPSPSLDPTHCLSAIWGISQVRLRDHFCGNLYDHLCMHQ